MSHHSKPNGPPPVPSRGRGVQPASMGNSSSSINYDGGRQGERPGQSQGLLARASVFTTSMFAQAAQPGSQYNDQNIPAEHETTRERMERYRKERDEADDEIVVLNSKLATMETELRGYEEAVLQTKESATRVRLAMQDKELFIGPQALDRTIQIQFNTLFKNVRTWSRYLGSASGGMEVDGLAFIDPAVRKQFELIAPGSDEAALTKIFANKSKRRYFFQGWIGLVIVENLLPTLPEAFYPGNSARDLWLDPEKAENLWQLERTLYCQTVPARDFNDWRAYSASLLSKSRGSDELPDQTVDMLWQRCRDAIVTISRWTPGEQEQQDMSNELLNIFNEAVRLSKLLRVQRAYWSIRFPFAHILNQNKVKPAELIDLEPDNQESGKLWFDRNTMKSVEPHDEDEPTDNKQVELFISPGLYKSGDADGEKFDAFSIIEPSSVMWIEVEGLPTHRSTASQTTETRIKPVERKEVAQSHHPREGENPEHQQDTQKPLPLKPQAGEVSHNCQGLPEGSDPMDMDLGHKSEPKNGSASDLHDRREPTPKPKTNAVKDFMKGSRFQR